MSFAVDLRRIAESKKAVANSVVRKIVLDLGTSVVLKSPVGDATYWKSSPPPGYVGGRFRANWQFGIGSPDTTTTDDIDKSGSSSIGRIEAGLPPKAIGNVYYITNSLPYAIPLEDGHSRQAPNGMVKLTTLEFEPIVEAAAKALA